MKTGANCALFDYWNALRASRIAPRRFEIEPAQIADILPDTFILEYREQGAFVYRLAGTRVCEIFGREMRGENFLECWLEPERFALNRHLNVSRRTGAVLDLVAEAEPGGPPPIRFEIVILPLFHTGDQIERFLGGIAPLHWPASRPKPIREDEGVRGHLKQAMFEIVYPSQSCVVDAYDNLGLNGTEPLVFDPVRKARIVRQDRRQFRVYEGGRSGGGED